MHLQLTERLTKAPGAPANGQPSCPFCTDLRPRGPAADVQHLRRRHHVMHAIHAILKTPAFKCVYCLGVYMEPSSARTISIHVQRCRCAPHSAKEAERRLNPDPASAGGRAASRRGVAAARYCTFKGRAGDQTLAVTWIFGPKQIFFFFFFFCMFILFIKCFIGMAKRFYKRNAK